MYFHIDGNRTQHSQIFYNFNLILDLIYSRSENAESIMDIYFDHILSIISYL